MRRRPPRAGWAEGLKDGCASARPLHSLDCMSFQGSVASWTPIKIFMSISFWTIASLI